MTTANAVRVRRARQEVARVEQMVARRQTKVSDIRVVGDHDAIKREEHNLIVAQWNLAKARARLAGVLGQLAPARNVIAEHQEHLAYQTAPKTPRLP